MVLALWALLSTYFPDIERLDDMMDGKIFFDHPPLHPSCLTDEDTEGQLDHLALCKGAELS